MKPRGLLLNHPLFSLHGASYFLGNLIRSFWRGEYVWHARPMNWPPADWFYLLSSIAMVTAFTVQLFLRWKNKTSLQRLIESQSFLLVLASVLFMAAISLPFDFQKCVNPSREHPFFVSGRIISGALLPFVLMYVAGMEFLLRPIRKWSLAAPVLAFLLLFITITEFQVRRAVFSSPYNFFALRTGSKSTSASFEWCVALEHSTTPPVRAAPLAAITTITQRGSETNPLKMVVMGRAATQRWMP